MGGNDINTLQKIMTEGKIEFLQKGFKDASLRSIVRQAGVTTGAFYGYFPDKQALFEALVSPAVNGLRELFLNVHKEFNELPGDTQLDTAYGYSANKLKIFIAYIYDNFDEFKLLITCAEGTAFEDFIHSLAEIEVDYTLKFFEATGNDALASGRITLKLVHIISSAYFSAVFEIVEHDMAREEADRYIDSLSNFFIAGWKAILLSS